MRNRLIYGVLLGAIVLAGLSTRSVLRELLGKFWAGNLGDYLWAAMVYVAICVVWPRTPASWAAAWTTAIATAVEVSQLYRAPWLDDLRRNTPAGLVLGYGFAWGDLLAYGLGVVTCWRVEMRMRRGV